MIEEKRKNGFIGLTSNNSYGLQCRVITKVETQIGYLQVLEYTLQDWSYLHVVQWHFNNDFEEDGNLIPKAYCETFYREKDRALQFAHKMGNTLLEQQYDIP